MRTGSADPMDSEDALDGYQEYVDRYNRGSKHDEIMEAIRAEHAFEFGPPPVVHDCSNWWIGLATAQWERKQLDPDVLAAVRRIVAEDVEADTWTSQDAYAKRKADLVAFVERISTPPKTPKRRVRPKLFRAPFTQGQIIAWQRDDDSWGAAACVGHSRSWKESAFSTIVTLHYHADEPPSAGAALGTPVVSRHFGAWNGSVDITNRCITRKYALPDGLHVVGEIAVDKIFGDAVYGYGYSWNLDDAADAMDAWHSDNPKACPPSIPLREFVSAPDDPNVRAMLEAIGRGNLGALDFDAQCEAYRQALEHWRATGWSVDRTSEPAIEAMTAYFGIDEDRASNRLSQAISSSRS